jgi:hypothetical protein
MIIATIQMATARDWIDIGGNIHFRRKWAIIALIEGNIITTQFLESHHRHLRPLVSQNARAACSRQHLAGDPQQGPCPATGRSPPNSSDRPPTSHQMHCAAAMVLPTSSLVEEPLRPG